MKIKLMLFCMALIFTKSEISAVVTAPDSIPQQPMATGAGHSDAARRIPMLLLNDAIKGEIENLSAPLYTINLCWPLPVHPKSGVILFGSGNHKVTLYDNGVHQAGKGRPWVVIYAMRY